MDRLDIEIFNTIVNDGTISKAAEALFLSPTTVGARLKTLEKELGITLIERGKGIKSIELTNGGKRFSVLASNMLYLWNECDEIKNQTAKTTFSIAAADSFFQYVLSPLFNHLIYDINCFYLELQLYPSDMIYPLVSRHSVDVGFAMTKMNYPNVLVKPLFESDVVVVTPRASSIKSKRIKPDALDPEKELFVGTRRNRNVGWGATFNAWHDSLFNREKHPLARVNSVSILSYLLDQGDYWALLPRQNALGYSRTHNLRILELDCPTPKWTCYMLTSTNNTNTTANTKINLFRQYLNEFITKNKLHMLP